MNRLALLILTSCAVANAQALWKFAVSGDSRNCGDVVMPAIAEGVKQNNAKFYWHLGDFRAMYMIDEDMCPFSDLAHYKTRAWDDFIEHQIKPFGHTPVYLAVGNHETIDLPSREVLMQKFSKWMDHQQRTYYRRIEHGVDFITLDNASKDQFDAEQLQWIQSVLTQDEASPKVTTIVVGMHAAFPGSVGHSHSMEDALPTGPPSGAHVYEELMHARDVAGKKVYVLASHSHFYMDDVYRGFPRALPGWIVGTAGAVRYELPPGVTPSDKARPHVAGYLVGSVMADGSISFEFHQLTLSDLLKANKNKRPEGLIRWCFEHNIQAEQTRPTASQPPAAAHCPG